MYSTLSEYYLLEYPKCNAQYDFLASWQGLAWPSHILQGVAFPFQVLTFYIIVKNTPNHMSVVKWPILINHFWCTWLDFTICAFSTPYIFLSYLGFLGVGLFSWYGIPYLFQIVLAILVAFCELDVQNMCLQNNFVSGASGSYIYLFESRSNSLQENRFKFKKSTSRFIYHVAIFILDLSLFGMFWSVPGDQDSARLQVLTLDPCPTPEFFFENVFIVTTDTDTIRFYTWFLIPFLLFHSIGHVLFHAACTVYYIFIAPTKSTSPLTRQIQRQFFVGLIFQTGIPVVFLAAPITYSMLAFFTDNLEQKWMNIAVIVAGLHGIGESLSVLMVHSSYRNAVWRLIPGCSAEKDLVFGRRTSSRQIIMQKLSD
ncbi:hypothetical protein CRE_09059 [Caenorhabditis remanei]|uniref:Serpentine Receptor, class H n=1 Tax=Caenorhabditis remanei TaxID=31234 RepID=E3LJ48_CAERE|nr:hypothetical protein CRE_09059 [Caenorhabditis remanei]